MQILHRWPRRDPKRPHHRGSTSKWSSDAKRANWLGSKARNRKPGMRRHMLTYSRRRCNTWIEYYLSLSRNCYQRRGNRQAYVQGAICCTCISWCGETELRSQFKQCPPNFSTNVDSICCYNGIRPFDWRYFPGVSPICKKATPWSSS